jgi:putative tricarboxylic transport membrane protein
VCVALVEMLGFVAAVGAYLLFLLLVVERLPLRFGGGVAVGATLSIYLIFAVWLRVPLPRGPWGF